MLLFTTIGIAGLILLLASFGLLESGAISDGLLYLVLNMAGSISMIVYAVGTDAPLFIILNGVWFAVAVLKIGSTLCKKAGPSRTTPRKARR